MIIDFHTHAFPEKIAQRALEDLKNRINIEPCTNGTADDLLGKITEGGADACVELNIAVKPGSETTINRVAAMNAEKWENKIFPFGSVNPESENAVGIVADIAAMGLKGIKFHPEYQLFYIDNEKYYKIYEAALRAGLIIIFHAGFDPYNKDSDMAGAERCARVAEKFAGEKIVFAHMGANCDMKKALSLFADKKVYLDTAFCATFCEKSGETEEFLFLIKKIGSDRVLLGSDCPWENPKKSIDFINNLPLTQSEKKNILGENAKRLLKIKGRE